MAVGREAHRSARAGFPWGALMAVAVWGASFVAVRIALVAFTPTGLVTLRLVVGTSLLGALLRLRGQRLMPVRADRRRCVVLGVVLGVHLVIQAVGLQFTTAVNTGWIIGVIPAMIALGAHLFLGQPLRGLGWLGIAVATTGIGLLTSITPEDFGQARLGDLLQLISCVTWTVYTLAAMGVLTRNDSLAVTTFTMGVAALVLVCALPFQGVLQATPATEAWLAAGFLSVVCSAVAYLLWARSLQRYGATRVGSVLYLEPLFTLAAATALLDEPVGEHTLVGGLLVLVGVWLVGRAAR